MPATEGRTAKARTAEAGQEATLRGPAGVGIVLPGDNRQRVVNSTTNPARWIGQIQTTWDDGSVSYGTGTLIGERYVLTCAHNFYNRTTNKYCTSVKFGPGYNRSAVGAAEQPFGSYDLDRWEVPEEYRLHGGPPPPVGGIPQADMTKYLHDYAVGRLDRFVDQNLGESAMAASWPGENVVNGLACDINGYSGDLDPTAHTQYTRNGNVQLTPDEDFVIYSMSTYHGDSGAPVYYKPVGQVFWRIIGVHVTGVPAAIPANGRNFAPALSGDRLDWIVARTN